MDWAAPAATAALAADVQTSTHVLGLPSSLQIDNLHKNLQMEYKQVNNLTSILSKYTFQ